MEYLQTLVAHPYLYQRMPMGLNISPSIWQSYINAILNCLQSKKYCKAIMDDLILFTPSKRVPYKQTGRYIECFIKEWTEDITARSANYSKPACNTWEMKCLLKTKRYV